MSINSPTSAPDTSASLTLTPPEPVVAITDGEAARMVREIQSPSVRSMLDCSAAGRMEKQPLAVLVEQWLPQGVIAHVQLNDRNRRGPGQGEQKFAPLLAALKRHRYAGDLAVEPFDYVPDGPGAAARAIGYVRGVLEALDNTPS